MKIAQVTWPETSMPPKAYGPAQLVAANIANGLADRGYKVYSFTSADSKVKGKIIPVVKSPTLDDPTIKDLSIYHSVVVAEAAKHIGDFDIIHSHLSHATLILLQIAKCPIVITIHGRYDDPHIREVYDKYAKDAYFVAISQYQLNDFPSVNWAGVIYHGINIKEFEYNDKPDDYMVYVGRTSPVKGLHIAMQAAIKAKQKLKIAAHKDITPEGLTYFEAKIQPYLENKYIDYLGEVSQDKVRELINKAKAKIFAIQWDEPFGLVIAEANACGTPAIAFARGSMPEIIEDGKSGYLVNSNGKLKRGSWQIKTTGLNGLCKAIHKINSLSEIEYKKMRKRCREIVEEKFTTEKMVDGYVEVYKKIIKDYRKKHW